MMKYLLNSMKKEWSKGISILLITLYLTSAYFSFAISNIVLGVAFVFFVWTLVSKRIIINWNKKSIFLYFIIVIPFLLTFLSTINAVIIPLNLNFIISRIPILIVAFIILNTLDKEILLIPGAAIFIIASIIAVLFTMYNLYHLLPQSLIKINTDLSATAAPIQRVYLGYYLLLALVFLKYLFKDYISKYLFYTIVLLLVYGIYISASRMAYMLLLLILIFDFSRHFSLKKWITISILLVLSFIVLMYFNDNVKNRFAKSFNPKTSARIMIWNNAYQVYKYSEYPILGISISDYYQNKTKCYWLRGKIEKNKSDYKGFYGFEPHNQYLDFVLFNGVLGVLFIIGIFYLGYLIFKGDNKFAMILYFIPVGVMLVESVFMRQWGIILYSIPLSIAISLSKNQ